VNAAVACANNPTSPPRVLRHKVMGVAEGSRIRVGLEVFRHAPR